MDSKFKVIKILARIIDIHLVKPISLLIENNNPDKQTNKEYDDNPKIYIVEKNSNSNTAQKLNFEPSNSNIANLGIHSKENKIAINQKTY